MTKFYFKIIFFSTLFLLAGAVQASNTNGTIDIANNSALLYSNSSLINFGCSNYCNVAITDTALTGYAWSTNLGWINLNPAQSGVVNNGNGSLSGYAWGENAGWINFNPPNGGVTINSSGQFTGFVWSENYGWIVFDPQGPCFPLRCCEFF